jgi:hypothetical protein
MSRRRKTAKTPKEIAAELEATRARKRVLSDLQRQPDLMIKATPNHEIISIQRLDVFSLFLQRRTITIEQFNAVRRLEERQAVAMGHEKRERPTEFVQAGTSTDQITGAMIDASAEVEDILKACGAVNARLLIALTAYQAAIFTRWRDTVEKVTGETRPECQAAAIRSACANLAEAWMAFDYRRRAA